jgi:hypothetical protein
MENKLDSNDASQVYLRPRKNPQIRIGSSYQAAIPESENINKTIQHLENFPSHHPDSSIHQIKIENFFKYNENFIAFNKMYQYSPKEDELMKPGKKRRIEK